MTTGVLTQRLAEYADHLTQLPMPHLVSRLRPGASSESVRATLAHRGMQAPEELVELYSWHDGTETTPELRGSLLWFTPPYFFASLATSAQMYDELMAAPGRWDASWWPIAFDNAGSYLNAVCFDEPNTVAPVLEYWTETHEEAVIHVSLERWIATLKAGMASGAIHVAADGGLDVDDAQYLDEIGPALNPGVPFWHE